MLNVKQEKFVQEFLRTGNATQSAIASGYSEHTADVQGARLLRNVKVSQRLKELQAEVKNDKIMDAREMQETLTAIIRDELTEEVLMSEGCGDGITEVVTKTKKASFNDKVKAIQLLARMTGGLDANQVNIVVPIFGGEGNLED